jgi:DNA adenine methylase
LEEDGMAVARRFLKRSDTFLYLDPPYLTKADDLYLDTLQWRDHQKLAGLLRKGGRWMLTYDADDRVPSVLYQGLRCASFDIAHTAAVQHVGSEFAVFAQDLTLPELDLLGRGARFIAA